MSNDKNVQIVNIDGVKVVEINTTEFSRKRKIDWDGVEKYLKRYIGECYKIDETDEMVYIGPDFPDEYTHSKYKEKAYGTIGKAKANAAQAIPELIKTVTNTSYLQNKKEKHNATAGGGWFYGTVHFTLPITDENKRVIGKNAFKGRMVIRCNRKGLLFLYDIVDIKRET